MSAVDNHAVNEKIKRKAAGDIRQIQGEKSEYATLK